MISRSRRPFELAGRDIKRQCPLVAGTTSMHDDQRICHEWRRTKSPHWRFPHGHFSQIYLPDDIAGPRIQPQQMTTCTEHEQTTVC